MGTHYIGTPSEELALATYIKLARAAESVNGRINAHLAAVDLTVSQFGVLEALHHLGPMCQKDLAEKILKSPGNLTLVIDNLVKRDLVKKQRSTVDRRFVDIYLTPAGRKLIADFFPRHAAVVVREIGVLSAAEQAQLGNLCRKVGKGVQGQQDPSTDKRKIDSE